MAQSEKILVINAGSSSLKLAVREKAQPTSEVTAVVESIGTEKCRVTIRQGNEKREWSTPGADHEQALRAVLDELANLLGHPLRIRACGHRVVHGGERFASSCLITDAVLDGIRACAVLAPLHNPPAIRAIEAVMKWMPDLPQVAVFDTAFHQTMPPHAYRYAVPREWYVEHAVRRYGFHGISYQYLVPEASRLLEKSPDELQLLIAHLGNGCSAAAVKNGKCVDTSMGLTPLEGMVMGTRSGNVDPNLIGHMQACAGMKADEVLDALQRSSGLLGLSGKSHDMRELLVAAEDGDNDCALAVEVFCHRAARSLLALAAGLDRVDAVIFSGGIGEHSAAVRSRILAYLAILSPKIDPTRNDHHGSKSQGRITAEESPLTVLVVPTDEERLIAREARRVLDSQNR